MQWTVVESNFPRYMSSYPAGLGMPTGQNNPDNQPQQNSSHNNHHTNTPTHPHGSIMQYQGPNYSPQIISVNPNNMVNSYPQSLSTPTSPQDNDSTIVQNAYNHGHTPNQSPIQMQGNSQSSSSGGGGGGGGGPPTGGGSSSSSGGSNQQAMPIKRKRSINPQGDENFIKALNAVRFGGIGFCKAARLYGVNNRTLWLEYKKRGYPISRPSIKSRIKLEPNMTPPPSSTPNNEDTMENYEHIAAPINMPSVPVSETPPTPIMCPPHPHPMGVMSFLDTRHVDFPSSMHPMRQRYPDPSVNVNPSTMNIQGLNFNSM